MDKTLDTWIKTLKPSTLRPYNEGMNRYVEFTGLTPTKLIEQARKDYIDRVPPWELRSVKSTEDFIQDLKTKGLSDMSMLTYLYGIRNFYNYNKVPLPKLNNVNITAKLTDRYKETDLIKLEDVRKFVNACGTDQKLIKALTLTFLSSGQAQSEIHSLKGKHLKNVVNGVTMVKMTRGKTNTDYMFFIGSEALQAIKEYKPVIADDEYVFTTQHGKKLYVNYVDEIFARHAAKIGFDRKYMNPHRFRHFFKTQLSGLMDSTFIEYLMGHKLSGVQSSYFIGAGVQDKMLEQYLKNQDKITVFTAAEKLQKDYDELKEKSGDLITIREENASLRRDMNDMKLLIKRMLSRDGINAEDIPGDIQPQDFKDNIKKIEEKASKISQD